MNQSIDNTDAIMFSVQIFKQLSQSGQSVNLTQDMVFNILLSMSENPDSALPEQIRQSLLRHRKIQNKARVREFMTNHTVTTVNNDIYNKFVTWLDNKNGHNNFICYDVFRNLFYEIA